MILVLSVFLSPLIFHYFLLIFSPRFLPTLPAVTAFRIDLKTALARQKLEVGVPEHPTALRSDRTSAFVASDNGIGYGMGDAPLQDRAARQSAARSIAVSRESSSWAGARAQSQ
jgi:hypothetical protein